VGFGQRFVILTPGAHRLDRGLVAEAARRLEMVGHEDHHVNRPTPRDGVPGERLVPAEIIGQPAAAQAAPARHPVQEKGQLRQAVEE
jgi:hypothetical protein